MARTTPDPINGIFRIYDLAMREFVQVTMQGKEEPIRVIIAIGSRAFQRLEYLYNSPDTTKRVTYPVMALVRTDYSPADDRFRFHPRMKIAYEDEGNTKVALTAMSPQPTDIPYTLDIRTIKQRTMDEIVSKFKLKFIKDTGYITVDLGVYGQKWLSVKYDGSSDSSEVEVGEEERKLRTTISLQLRGWVLREPERQKIVRHFQTMHYADQDGSEDFLEQVEIDATE